MISSDHSVLIGLQTRNRLAYELLYRLALPAVTKYVRQDSGSRADAEDVFQETVIILAQKVQQPDFRLTASLKTFILAIARNVWLNRLRAQRRHPTCALTDVAERAVPSEEEASPASSVWAWLDRATPFCRLLLRALFVENETMERLMTRMKW